jgi:hypothetical protein
MTWAHWAVALGPTSIVAHANLQKCNMYVVFGMFLMSKHWIGWMYQYNKYMFNFIHIYIFIPVSGCVDKGSCALLCPGPMMLLRWPCIKDSFKITGINYMNKYTCIYSGLTKPGEVGDFFALVSMKSPNFCQKAKF